jgi:hypothetical protein
MFRLDYRMQHPERRAFNRLPPAEMGAEILRGTISSYLVLAGGTPCLGIPMQDWSFAPNPQ